MVMYIRGWGQICFDQVWTEHRVHVPPYSNVKKSKVCCTYCGWPNAFGPVKRNGANVHVAVLAVWWVSRRSSRLLRWFTMQFAASSHMMRFFWPTCWFWLLSSVSYLAWLNHWRWGHVYGYFAVCAVCKLIKPAKHRGIAILQTDRLESFGMRCTRHSWMVLATLKFWRFKVKPTEDSTGHMLPCCSCI